MNAHTATARAERTPPVHIGDHLREWRQRRHLSQLDLAGDAEISARHLSFVETGRAAPSRDMVLKLAERLNVPLRERNVLLVAAGYAPAFPQRSLDDPALKSARTAIDLVLRAHEPNPALAYDRHWNLVTANRMVMPLSSDNVAIPFKMRLDGDVLSFISTTMIFGTPVDITLSELALETFFPADDFTAERMREIAANLK